MDRRVKLRTDRLAVTTWLSDDVDELNRLHSDAVTMSFIGGRPETRDESAGRVGLYLDEQATRGWTKWRVEGSDGRMIGRAGFGSYAGDRELGYTLAREVWGQGLATEVATALVHWHAAHPAPRTSGSGEPMRLWGYADIDNVASIRVLTKAGLSLVETRQHEGRPYAFFRLDRTTP